MANLAQSELMVTGGVTPDDIRDVVDAMQTDTYRNLVAREAGLGYAIIRALGGSDEDAHDVVAVLHLSPGLMDQAQTTGIPAVATHVYREKLRI